MKNNIEVLLYNQPLDGPQGEVKEPIGRNMRNNHPKSQIIGDLAEKVQTRSSLKLQGH